MRRVDCTSTPKNIKIRAHLPAFIFRQNAAITVASSSPKDALHETSQKVVFVPGTTILWRGRAIHTSHMHLQRLLLPIRSILDLLSYPASSAPGETFIAAEHMEPTSPEVAHLHDYYLGDVPIHQRLSLSRLRPRLVCFHRVVALGSEYDGTADHHAHDRIKDLIEKHETLPARSLVRSCNEPNANRADVWICLLYTSPSPRDQRGSRMPSSA